MGTLQMPGDYATLSWGLYRCQGTMQAEYFWLSPHLRESGSKQITAMTEMGSRDTGLPRVLPPFIAVSGTHLLSELGSVRWKAVSRDISHILLHMYPVLTADNRGRPLPAPQRQKERLSIIGT